MEEVLAEDDDPAGAVWRAGDHEEGVRGEVDGLGGFPADSVEAEVHFVDGEELGLDAGADGGVFVLPVAVVGLDGCELGIVVAGVETDDIVDDGMGFGSLEGRGDGDLFIFAVDDVDKLILFHGTDHECSSLGITGQVLSGNDATTASFAVCFLVNFDEYILLCIEPQHDHTA